MLKQIHLATVGAAVMLATGAVAAQGLGGAGGIGGPDFKRSEAAQPAPITRERAAVTREAAQAAPSFDGWQYVGGEAGWVRAPQASTAAPEVRIAARAVQPYGEVSADGWKFAAGEAGWVRATHRYEFQGGKLAMVHEPWCVASHDLPAPSKSPLPSQEQQRALYPGA